MLHNLNVRKMFTRGISKLERLEKDEEKYEHYV